MNIINKLKKTWGGYKKHKKKETFFLYENPDYSNYQIGQYTYGQPKIISWDQDTSLTIGKFCSISSNVTVILGGEHRTDWVTTYPFNVVFPEGKQHKGHPSTKGDIVIGNDVWIGRGAVILSGVKIGDGAVIAAECVVTKSVEPYTIVGGNPQKIIRKRFTTGQIESLLKIAWWNWPIESILEALPLLLDKNIDEFIDRHS